MNISEINKLLGTSFSTIESFELEATWDRDIEGKKLNKFFIDQFPSKINWDYLSRRYNLSEDLIRLYADRVNWNYLSQFKKLSENFILEFKDKVLWKYITKYQFLSENFIENNIDYMNWSDIVENQKLSEQFIEKNIHSMDIDSVIKYQNITDKFILKYKNVINWKDLTSYFIYRKGDAENFSQISKCKDYLDWHQISKYCYLSIPFIKNFVSYVKWDEISKRTSISDDFIRKFYERLDWKEISQKCNLSEELIEEFCDFVHWDFIGVNIEYSLPFIYRHKDKLKNAKITTDDISIIKQLKDCISFICINYFDFSEEFLYEYKDKVDWEKLIKSRRLSEALLDNVSEYFGDWEWRWISDAQPLSENFIRKHYYKVSWGGVCMYQTLSEKFIEEFDIVNRPFTNPFDKCGVFTMGRIYSKHHIWWESIIKYQKLTSDFIRRKSNSSLYGKIYTILPYQKNEFASELLSNLTAENRKKYLSDSWLYKSKEFRKEQVTSLNKFECYGEYFIASVFVDSNRYLPKNFHNQFLKDMTLEIFATQTKEEYSNGYPRSKGFVVGDLDDLVKYYNYDPIYEVRAFNAIKVKVNYENVVRVINLNVKSEREYVLIRCNLLHVLE